MTRSVLLLVHFKVDVAFILDGPKEHMPCSTPYAVTFSRRRCFASAASMVANEKDEQAVRASNWRTPSAALMAQSPRTLTGGA